MVWPGIPQCVHFFWVSFDLSATGDFIWDDLSLCLCIVFRFLQNCEGSVNILGSFISSDHPFGCLSGGGVKVDWVEVPPVVHIQFICEVGLHAGKPGVFQSLDESHCLRGF